jgi:hypothetical protein
MYFFILRDLVSLSFLQFPSFWFPCVCSSFIVLITCVLTSLSIQTHIPTANFLISSCSFYLSFSAVQRFSKYNQNHLNKNVVSRSCNKTSRKHACFFVISSHGNKVITIESLNLVMERHLDLRCVDAMIRQTLNG